MLKLAMKKTENRSNKELKELIMERLDGIGIDRELIRIDIAKGPTVILKGEVYSDGAQAMIEQAVMDVVGICSIVDELIVIRDLDDSYENENRHSEDNLYYQDDDIIGTEDIYRAIEDGIPYIPPTSPTYRESSNAGRRKKRRTSA